jgi:predicted nuclease with TOPRIM domain
VLQDVQAKAKELQAEVLKLEQKVAAGKMLVNTLTSEKEKLEGLMKEATARQLLEVETLRGTCKELETQVSLAMTQPPPEEQSQEWQQARLSKHTA